nr:SUMF1/EgtB/PvdO family nonheme iron enzyme [Planctomycetota bacterium]
MKPDAHVPGKESIPIAVEQRVDEICSRFEDAWRNGECPQVEQYLGNPEGPERRALLAELLAVEIAYREMSGENPNPEEFLARFPNDADLIRLNFEQSPDDACAVPPQAARQRTSIPVTCPNGHNFRVKAKHAGRRGKCPHCDQTVQVSAIPLEACSVETSAMSLGETVVWRPDGDALESSDAGADPSPAEMDSIGHFRLIEVLGQGAFGTVHRAYDSRLDREVALKVPRKEMFQTEEHFKRFLREARAAANLRHPNICPVYEIGDQDGQHYIVMAYIAGKDLRSVIEREKEIDQRKAALAVRKLALALEEAHQKGIVHRDLKPSNIMIDRRGEPVIMDFGLAQRSTASESQITHNGQLLGTPAYMSPEQARGDIETTGPASDIFSLGVILYELLCGERPFNGPVTAVLVQIATQEPASPSVNRPDLDPRLEAICLKAMAKDSEDRYASMRQFADELKGYLKSTTSETSHSKPDAPSAAVAQADEKGSDENASVVLAQEPRDDAETGPGITPATAERAQGQGALSDDSISVSLPKASILIALRRRLSGSRWFPNSWKWLAVAAGLLFPLLLWGLMISLTTPDGTLIVEIDDPDAIVQVLGDEGKVLVESKGKDGQIVFSVDPGKRRVRVEKNGIEVYAEDVTVVSGGNMPIRARWEPPTIPAKAADDPDSLLLVNFDAPTTALFPDPLLDYASDYDGISTRTILDSPGALGSAQALRWSYQTKKDVWVQANVVLRGSREQFFDLTPYDSVSFYVKGIRPRSAAFMIHAKPIGESDVRWSIFGFDCAKEWKKVTIDLEPEKLSHLDLRKVFEFSLGYMGSRDGDENTLWIDEIACHRKPAGIAPTASGQPPLAVAPFNAAQAKQHQKAWADYLGVPVERDFELPGGEKLTMMLIPPGEFMMGSSDKEKTRFRKAPEAVNYEGAVDQIGKEYSQHQVRITRPFWLSRHEVTRSQFRLFVQETGYTTEAERDEKGGFGYLDGRYAQDPRFVWSADLGFPQTDEHPVVNVSWNDAEAFCKWLSTKQGGRYRLPTQAQWEYACRAGTATAWHCGDDEGALQDAAWFDRNGEGRTHPVGELRPNGYGLQDMHGNVWEWCADWDESDSGVTSLRTDPGGPTKGLDRVRRGGSAYNPGILCRSAYRNSSGPRFRVNDTGFRVACEIPDTTPESKPVVPGTTSAGPPAKRQLPPDAPQPAIAPFNTDQAKEHQLAWADYLGVPVEQDFELSGDEKLTMVLIPPGEFMMGSTAEEQARFLEEAKAADDEWCVERIPGEGPQHRVRITRPFYLGKCEVTQAQWEAMMGKNPSRFTGDASHPVEQVSWDDVQQFLARVNGSWKNQDLECALPTEAQWEYACRAGTTTLWHCGNNEAVMQEYAWFTPNNGGETHPVGKLRPNGFGVHDMHGHVWEWCADWYSWDYYTRSLPDDPRGP